MNRYKRYLLMSIMLVSFFGVALQAQVVIGSASDPNPGSLLDIKETGSLGANSKRGLALPRVNLEALTTLPPKDATFSGDALHVGLLVYNLTSKPKEFLCPGVYTWDGTKWVYMHSKGCACEYTIVGSDGKEYRIYCDDFQASSQATAQQPCSTIPTNGMAIKYHLLTGNEFYQVWNKPAKEDNQLKFANGSTYYVNYLSWITVGNVTAGLGEVLGLGFSFPGGAPIGAKITGNKIIRCVRD